MERIEFNDEVKLRLVEAAFQPGVKAIEIARRQGVDVSLLCRYRSPLFVPLRRVPAFMPITVATDEPSLEDAPEPTPVSCTPPAGIIEVEFAVARLRITGPANPAPVGTMIAALSGRSA